jgi:hypothetical protein
MLAGIAVVGALLSGCGPGPATTAATIGAGPASAADPHLHGTGARRPGPLSAWPRRSPPAGPPPGLPRPSSASRSNSGPSTTRRPCSIPEPLTGSPLSLPPGARRWSPPPRRPRSTPATAHHHASRAGHLPQPLCPGPVRRDRAMHRLRWRRDPGERQPRYRSHPQHRRSADANLIGLPTRHCRDDSRIKYFPLTFESPKEDKNEQGHCGTGGMRYAVCGMRSRGRRRDRYRADHRPGGTGATGSRDSADGESEYLR